MKNKSITRVSEVQLVPGRVLLIAGGAGMGKTKMAWRISPQNNKTIYCLPKCAGGYIASQLTSLPEARLMEVSYSLKPGQFIKVWEQEFERYPFSVLVVDEVPISRSLVFVRWLRAFCFRYQVAGILTRSLRNSNKTAVQNRDVQGLGLRGLKSEALSLLVISSLDKNRESETVRYWRAERESCEWRINYVEQSLMI